MTLGSLTVDIVTFSDGIVTFSGGTVTLIGGSVIFTAGVLTPGIASVAFNLGPVVVIVAFPEDPDAAVVALELLGAIVALAEKFLISTKLERSLLTDLWALYRWVS